MTFHRARFRVLEAIGMACAWLDSVPAVPASGALVALPVSSGRASEAGVAAAALPVKETEV